MALLARLLRRASVATLDKLVAVADRLFDHFAPPISPMTHAAIEKAAQALQNNPRVLVCAGSGLSAESGVPTFRGPDGIFSDDVIATMTNVETFESGDRAQMLRWYQSRRDQLHTIEPNPGHEALIKMTRTGDYTIATQNVDHLLEAAADKVGFRPELLHIHGSLLTVRCHRCGDEFEDLTLDLGTEPTCDKCGGPLRPGVVWFGEMLPPGALERSTEAAQQASVCLLLGTSGLVYPAAALPELARQFGATIIEVNPNPSALSDIADIVIRGKTGEVLPALLQEIKKLNKK